MYSLSSWLAIRCYSYNWIIIGHMQLDNGHLVNYLNYCGYCMTFSLLHTFTSSPSSTGQQRPAASRRNEWDLWGRQGHGSPDRERRVIRTGNSTHLLSFCQILFCWVSLWPQLTAAEIWCFRVQFYASIVENLVTICFVGWLLLKEMH